MRRLIANGFGSGPDGRLITRCLTAAAVALVAVNLAVSPFALAAVPPLGLPEAATAEELAAFVNVFPPGRQLPEDVASDLFFEMNRLGATSVPCLSNRHCTARFVDLGSHGEAVVVRVVERALVYAKSDSGQWKPLAVAVNGCDEGTGVPDVWLKEGSFGVSPHPLPDLVSDGIRLALVSLESCHGMDLIDTAPADVTVTIGGNFHSLSVSELKTSIAVEPKAREFPLDLLRSLAGSKFPPRCDQDHSCFARALNLDGRDGWLFSDEMMLAFTGLHPVFAKAADGHWVTVATVKTANYKCSVGLVRSGMKAVKTAPPGFPDLVVDGHRLTLIPYVHTPIFERNDGANMLFSLDQGCR
jgi:hypothetical protein